MAYTTETLGDVVCFDGRILPPANFLRVVLGVAVFLFAALAAAWMIAASSTPHLHSPRTAPVAPNQTIAANPFGGLGGAANSFRPAPVLTGPGHAADVALNSVPSPPPAEAPAPDAAVPPPPPPHAAELTQNVPLPPSRPDFFRPKAGHASLRSSAAQGTPQNTSAAPARIEPDTRSFFQKLFDRPQQPSGQALAYAQPEDGSIGGVPAYKSVAPAPSDGATAVYDVAARTVYLPNGDRLEAHSGYGPMLDDPRRVNEKDRGPTPPHAYDLALREQRFHGVQALRLIPVGSGNMYGRTGLLAHTYMLGPNGDSNGCVSFKDYNRFLQAYLRGEIKHLVVVAHLG